MAADIMFARVCIYVLMRLKQRQQLIRVLNAHYKLLSDMNLAGVETKSLSSVDINTGDVIRCDARTIKFIFVVHNDQKDI